MRSVTSCEGAADTGRSEAPEGTAGERHVRGRWVRAQLSATMHAAVGSPCPARCWPLYALQTLRDTGARRSPVVAAICAFSVHDVPLCTRYARFLFMMCPGDGQSCSECRSGAIKRRRRRRRGLRATGTVRSGESAFVRRMTQVSI